MQEFTNNIREYYWSFDDLIGQSDNCKVYKVYDMTITDPDQRCFAIKVIPMVKFTNN